LTTLAPQHQSQAHAAQPGHDKRRGLRNGQVEDFAIGQAGRLSQDGAAAHVARHAGVRRDSSRNQRCIGFTRLQPVEAGRTAAATDSRIAGVTAHQQALQSAVDTKAGIVEISGRQVQLHQHVIAGEIVAIGPRTDVDADQSRTRIGQRGTVDVVGRQRAAQQNRQARGIQGSIAQAVDFGTRSDAIGQVGDEGSRRSARDKRIEVLGSRTGRDSARDDAAQGARVGTDTDVAVGTSVAARSARSVNSASTAEDRADDDDRATGSATTIATLAASTAVTALAARAARATRGANASTREQVRDATSTTGTAVGARAACRASRASRAVAARGGNAAGQVDGTVGLNSQHTTATAASATDAASTAGRAATALATGTTAAGAARALAATGSAATTI